MSFRSSVVVALLATLFSACSSSPKAPCADTQRVVESVATLHPECVRLTVHSVPPNGGEHVVVASTVPAKLGRRSDPEDLQAMRTGNTIVLDESGAVDVTVPILEQDGAWTAACGVTLRADAGNRTQLRARAQVIARAIESSLRRQKKS